MKLNIKRKTLTALALASVLGLGSCHSDLDRRPTNIQTEGYSTPTLLKQSLAKVYGAYGLSGNGDGGDVAGIDEGSSDFLRGYFNLQELSTDEAICSWTDVGLPELHELAWSSSNSFVKGLYYRSLYQIKLASYFIAETNGLSEADLPDLKKSRAEVRFLRAFQYWLMMDVFGNPPFVTEATGVGKVKPAQISRAELFKYVESELLAILPDLAEPRQNEYGRADRAAAWALLSRLYLNAEVYTGSPRYSEAAEYADKVITSGVYSLKPSYESLFLIDGNVGNNETILSINYDGLRGHNYGGTTLLINASTNSDAAAATGKNWGVGGWGGYRATKAFSDLFDKSRDSRYLMGATQEEITDVKEFKQGVWVYKFRNVTSSGAPGQHNTFSDVDFPLFRLAEMYLNYAEAAARGGADATKGLTYLNKVRERAYGNVSGNFTSLQLSNILDERGRELYWEGFRRTDLIRFGQFTSGTKLWPWKGGVAPGRAVADYLSLYPLPSDEVQANPNLKQNVGY